MMTDEQLKTSEEFRLLTQVTVWDAKDRGERRYVIYGPKGNLIGNTDCPDDKSKVVLEAYPGGRMVLWNGRWK